LCHLWLWQLLVDLPKDMVVEVPRLIQAFQPSGLQPLALGNLARLNNPTIRMLRWENDKWKTSLSICDDKLFVMVLFLPWVTAG